MRTLTQRNATLPDRQPDGASDRRWVVIGEDGRYVTLGRAVDPTEDEVRDVERQLIAQGNAGWLAVMSSSPYGPVMPLLMMVRPLASPTGPWAAAEQACRALITAQRTAA